MRAMPTSFGGAAWEPQEVPQQPFMVPRAAMGADARVSAIWPDVEQTPSITGEGKPVACVAIALFMAPAPKENWSYFAFYSPIFKRLRLRSGKSSYHGITFYYEQIISILDNGGLF
jgi:hypothetical protein